MAHSGLSNAIWTRTTWTPSVTHLHPDHCLDLTGLYVFRKYRPGTAPLPPIPVHARPRARRSALHAAYDGMDESGMRDQLAFAEVRDGAVGGRGRFGSRPRRRAPRPGVRLVGSRPTGHLGLYR